MMEKKTISGRPVRVGAIGAGWWATTNHFPLLAGRPDVELVSVCRPGAELLETVRDRFGFQHATEDYRELLEQDLDAVLIASPHNLHYEHAKAALEKGLHTLCEKPFTLDARTAWELVELAEARGLHAIVPYGWHYKPFILQAKQWLDRGLVGEIEYAMCHMASPTKGFFSGEGAVPSQWDPQVVGPDPRTWQTPGAGGGYAHGQLTHSSALMLWLTGLRASRVSALMSGPGAPVDLYDAAQVVFDNGALGVVSGAGTLPDDDKFQIDLRIFGSEGVLLLDVERERAVLRRHDGRSEEAEVVPGEGDYSCEIPPVRLIELVSGASRENHSPLEVAARSVELLEAMHTSAAHDGQPKHISADRTGQRKQPAEQPVPS
ncbi:Oxidoreductase domain protein [Sinomonas atrocyanea]|uniref:Oxidoreductase domain protein n=1 Tax=Sinomonas atrocyanea TaxID=37927 RepID=A0A126ZWU1_9MICC|nr:Gfo/Idh/MocA family oxidoreductase [Sinomonas atrocyanea]AMM31648.1 Oxidoreductase domain protein [Sinomonas atrocyanea]GEB64200.1 hypothetical protein SAT01_16480 [Sinomonas atrocyanea]GGG57166.1 hypothetical protein GCM10007172_05070 [Sinomonas atrocyanea]